MQTRKTLLAFIMGMAVFTLSGCFSDSDNDDDSRQGNTNSQSSSLTALTTSECNRTPEDEEPQDVTGLGFTGDPDTETQQPSSSTFSDNCI